MGLSIKKTTGIKVSKIIIERQTNPYFFSILNVVCEYDLFAQTSQSQDNVI